MAEGLFWKTVDSYCLSYRLGDRSLGRDVDQTSVTTFIPQSLKKNLLAFYDGIEVEVFFKNGSPHFHEWINL